MSHKLDILINSYFSLEQQIHESFGYVEDWVKIPMEDSRIYYWRLTGEGRGDSVGFADTVEELNDTSGNYYEEEIYTQRFLKKWVYRGEHLTMVCCNTGVDGNKFLRIFENSKERKES